MRKVLGPSFVLVLVTGCVFSSTITLRQPTTGQVAECPWYIGGLLYALVAEQQQRHSVEDFQRQGYERVP